MTSEVDRDALCATISNFPAAGPYSAMVVTWINTGVRDTNIEVSVAPSNVKSPLYVKRS